MALLTGKVPARPTDSSRGLAREHCPHCPSPDARGLRADLARNYRLPAF